MTKKIIILIAKIAVITFFALTFILGMMLFVSSGGERDAKNLCNKAIIGEKFNLSVFGNNKPLGKEYDQQDYYSFIFPMNFDQAAYCKIYIDENDIIVRTEIDIF